LGTNLAALGKLVRARRALEAAAADPTVGDLARSALAEVPEPQLPKAPPVGRNDPCPCGSGKKYKKCHGA
ncbi:MAG TPA: SEC-C metal-binding domain-containing protein, partial [Chloroflexota bacterium]|nr:SEC-C metal-binding domain-containing protein [Chloroflexota bacterium]